MILSVMDNLKVILNVMDEDVVENKIWAWDKKL